MSKQVDLSLDASLLSQLGKIAIVMGGWSAEREISLNSGNAVLRTCQGLGLDAVGIDLTRDNVTSHKIFDGIDRVFLVLHGTGGEDGVVQGLLDAYGIPYTGSGVMASALAMDKLRAKQVMQASGVPVLPSVGCRRGRQVQEIDFALPWCVKPVNQGSSFGITCVESQDALDAALALAFEYDSTVMIEPWVCGREYTVGIVGTRALPVIWIETLNGFYDYKHKYEAGQTNYNIPSGLTQAQESWLQVSSLQAFEALGACGWGRVDWVSDDAGNFWVLELNTIPGMTNLSLVPQAALQVGIDFEQLVTSILLESLSAKHHMAHPL